MPRYCSTARKVMTPGSVHTTLPSSNSHPINATESTVNHHEVSESVPAFAGGTVEAPAPLDGQVPELNHGLAGGPPMAPVPTDGQGLELLHGFAGASQSLENIDNDKQKKGNGFKMFE